VVVALGLIEASLGRALLPSRRGSPRPVAAASLPASPALVLAAPVPSWGKPGRRREELEAAAAARASPSCPTAERGGREGMMGAARRKKELATDELAEHATEW